MSDATPHEPAAPSESAAPAHDPVEVAMARLLAHPDVVRAIAAFDLRAYRRALDALAATHRDVAEATALRRLHGTVRPFARPVRSRFPLFLTTISGCGMRLVGQNDPLVGTHVAVRWVSLFFLPLWPLGAYIVREPQGYTYDYLAEVPFDPRLRWAALAVPAGLALVFAILRLKGG